MTPASTSLDRYDTIGVGYRRHRRPDPRVAARIHASLGDAHRILDVGSGAGSYEPDDRMVVAVDASAVMLRQHPGPRRVRGAAEHLPFPDGAFDAAMAIFTVHHWNDLEGGLAELRRVARRQVILTFDHDMEGRFWLSDYVPAMLDQNHSWAATIEGVTGPLHTDHVEVLPVPHDCIDGFMAAYWRRPERYLDPSVRASISGLALLAPADIEPGMRRLADDLASGAWHERYGHLLDLDEFDAGYRIVVAGDGR
jgi:SAM-dependent methyltransferase